MIRRSGARVLFLAIVSLLVIFLIGPSLLMAIASFSGGGTLTFPPQGFGLHWYATLFDDEVLRAAFVNTAWVALVCTLVSTAAGTAAAIALARYGIPFRAGVELFMLLPFTIPLAVEGVGLLNVSGALGLIGVRWAIGIAIAATNLPFVTGAVSSAARRLDPSIEEAASSCGAYPVERFVTVTVPSLLPGILAGGLIMFITACNEFVICSFLVDVRSMTLPVELYNQARGVATPMIAAVSVCYTVVSIGAIWGIDRLAGIDSFLRASR
jgi:putative spermidine/putrescine transport system permease protein